VTYERLFLLSIIFKEKGSFFYSRCLKEAQGMTIEKKESLGWIEKMYGGKKVYLDS